MIRQEEVYKIGKIGKPHGVKGELTLFFDDDVFDRVDADYLVLLIDGILVLSDPRLRREMDIRIFVDTDADIRILRRMRRDVNERRRTLDSVMEQYLATVKPMHEAFVEPSKKYADIIIPEGGHNLVAMEMLKDRIRHHLA